MLREVQRVYLRCNEAIGAALSESEVPYAPVHHCELQSLEIQDNFSSSIVGDIDPDRAVFFKKARTLNKPVLCERQVSAARHIIFPSTVVDLPVERWIGEDQVNASRW